MKKILLAQSERNYLLFTLGIKSSYRISYLIRVQSKHVLDSKNSVRSHLIMTEQKTGKENKVALSKGVKKAIESNADQHYEGDLEACLFRSRKGTNQAISRVQAWTKYHDGHFMEFAISTNTSGVTMSEIRLSTSSIYCQPSFSNNKKFIPSGIVLKMASVPFFNLKDCWI